MSMNDVFGFEYSECQGNTSKNIGHGRVEVVDLCRQVLAGNSIKGLLSMVDELVEWISSPNLVVLVLERRAHLQITGKRLTCWAAVLIPRNPDPTSE
jgi:hypothetical protein